MEELIRLQKFLANNGVASRRKAEEYILEGKVKVNGKVVTELGTKVNPKVDKVEFLEKEIRVLENRLNQIDNKNNKLNNIDEPTDMYMI